MPKLETKTVWVGIYGGHYDAIVFFNKKPKLSKETIGHSNIRFYDCLDNRDLIIGCMWYGDFKELFPDANLGEAKDIEIPEVFKLKLRTYWEDDKLKQINFNADGWVK